MDKREMQFAYQDGDACVFVDTESDEHIALPNEQLGEWPLFLKEGARAHLVFSEGKPFSVEAPSLVELIVVDTASHGDRYIDADPKPAVLETGLRVMVPAFVNVGDTIVVDTATGEYRDLPYNGLHPTAG